MMPAGGSPLPWLALLLISALGGCTTLPNSADNEALVARYYEEVFNQRNLDFLATAMHEDVVGHGPGAQDEVRGLSQVAEFSAYVYVVYEDYKLVVNELSGSGNRVHVRATVTAVHKPTGKRVKFFGLSEYRLESGKIAEYWRAYDRLDLYENQLDGWRPGI